MNRTRNIIKESFAQYAGAVAQSRAFVDVRDGLKPSNRQINYCLLTDKFLPNKPFKKTLKAIGSIARMYIHGDASAEGIIMRSGQEFAMRYPLMEIEGNGGNLMMSGNWAAPRYTGARLSDFGTLMFTDVDKDTIETWIDNYDDTEKYPSVLPSKGYYNIVNGTSGIGVGVASSIPQFNIRDVNRSLEVLLLNPDCEFDDIYCPPDFATGAYLINEKEVKETLKYGSKKLAKENQEVGASCKLRSKIDYDEKENCLVVTEIPYSVYTNTICGQLENIINSNEIENPGIDRFNDLTGLKPLIKIYLSKNVNPNKIISYLYKNTSLQYHYAINMTMLDKGKYPKVFTWKEALQAHIDHEKEVYRRGFEFDLKKIEHRIHIINGLLICLASIDEVVTKIKISSSPAEAKGRLIAKFLLDEEQAQAVLDMKLSRLAHLEVKKLEDEKANLEIEAEKLNKILNNIDLFNNELIKNWRSVATKYGDEHRTKIISVVEDDKEDKEIATVIPEDCVVVTTVSGSVKRVPPSNYKVQKRNTKGTKNDELILDVIKTNTVDTMLFFTDAGKMYRCMVDKIPAENTKGTYVGDLVKIEGKEKVVAVSSLHRNSLPKYAIFFTKNGLIKKTLLTEYMKNGRGGIQAIKLGKDDKIVKIIFMDDEDLIVVTKDGMGIKFPSTEVTAIGRVSTGVKAIKLDVGDELVTALPVHKDTDDLALFTQSGLGKKMPLSEVPKQSRGGKGVIIYKDETVVGAAMVSDNDNILITGVTNSVVISATDIPKLSRISAGNAMIKGCNIKSISKI